ncbi:hypothetical protein D0Z67_29490 (plasmid) [Streptomyces seoulensis]|uniref:Uncharacterized protein n=1 Tax=Streptomyces seoulensis TaxID=73044 RepID=A0A4P6U5T8_STRSO|nr:hypothetical protein [Streptomyces seoulensis]QBJ94504.1 hypothetical protein D0Z67_29490 [Streptomyces seoulensis]
MAGSLRSSAAAGARHLRQEGHHEWAQAIETLLAPGGWNKLKQTADPAATSPLSVSTDDELKAALQDALDEFETSIRIVAEEAYEKVLSGEWLPPKTGQRRLKGTGLKRAVLSVDVNAELRGRLQAELPRLSDQEGRRISEGGIIMAYACSELGVDRGTGLDMKLYLPEPVIAHFRSASESSGVSLEQAAAKGISELLDGSWSMPKPVRFPKHTWADTGWNTLPVRVEDSQRTALHELAPELSKELGARVFPGTILRQVLINQFGMPD